MSGPFTTITVDQWHALTDVLVRADRLCECICEFPKELNSCGEHLDALIESVNKAKALTKL